MNKDKISDVVDVWAQSVGLTDRKYINLIKTDIAKRCMMYEDTIGSISVQDDPCQAYILKPVDGRYSVEDFLLNRLMLGLREISFSGAIDGLGGEYTADSKSLNVNVNKINSKVNEKATRHPGLQGKNAQIIKKTIEHELGHCFKTSFSDGVRSQAFVGGQQDNVYRAMIEGLSKYKNGMYASQVKTIDEMDFGGNSDVIRTGVNDSKENEKYDYRVYLIDELLNETEALELTKSNDVHEIWRLQKDDKNSPSGNYVNVYNYISGYAPFSGYGKILKSLLGKQDCFKAEYISSQDIFKQFDEEYADIANEVWGIDSKKIPPMKCLYLEFGDLKGKKYFDEKIMLKLDEFVAKCYQKKIKKMITQNGGELSEEQINQIQNDIGEFQARMTTNNDEQKRNQLAHNIVFNNIRDRIQQKTVGEKIDNTNVKQKQKTIENESPKMKFVNGFISAYEDAEEQYQYDNRVQDEGSDLKRLRRIIDTNGMDRNLLIDLEGRRSGDASVKGHNIEYSQKQVSAMARLLKLAQDVTNSQKLNLSGRNYLEEFTNIPAISQMLKEMRMDLKDENSYMYKLRENARANRENGTLPNYPVTKAEKKFLDRQEQTISEESITRSSVVDLVRSSQITYSEISNETQTISDVNKVRKLMQKQKDGISLNDDELKKISVYMEQTNGQQTNKQVNDVSVEK